MIELEQQIGVVIFDDPELPSLGWASLNGERPRRIKHLADLESDGVFISNLSWQQIRNINASREPRLRTSNFFREELALISQDLDLPIIEDPASCLDKISEFFSRCVRLAAEMYGFERVGMNLKETIYDVLFPHGEPTSFGTPKIDEAFDEAYLPLQKCYVSTRAGSRNAKLRFSRSVFASLLNQFPIPVGPWSIYQGKIPTNTKECMKGEGSAVYQFLKEFGSDKPALCLVSVRNIESRCADLLAFTNGTARRNWVPIQEAAFLSTIGEVTVKKIIQGTRYQSYEDVSFGWQNQSVVGDVSYSLGLVAESHIAALSSGTRKKQGGVAYSPRAVFIKAWDRIMLFKVAYALYKNDVHIRSYAMGAINVCVEDYQLEFLSEEALKLGLTPPLWLLNANETDEQLNDSTSSEVTNFV